MLCFFFSVVVGEFNCDVLRNAIFILNIPLEYSENSGDNYFYTM